MKEAVSGLTGGRGLVGLVDWSNWSEQSDLSMSEQSIVFDRDSTTASSTRRRRLPTSGGQNGEEERIRNYQLCQDESQLWKAWLSCFRTKDAVLAERLLVLLTEEESRFKQLMNVNSQSSQPTKLWQVIRPMAEAWISLNEDLMRSIPFATPYHQLTSLYPELPLEFNNLYQDFLYDFQLSSY
jgi:hypothetical protein